MKTLLIFLIPLLTIAQSNQIAIMGGNKALELSFSYTAPNEVIYGIAIAGTDSSIAEKRANKFDQKEHVFQDKYIPTIFGLIGGEFDNLSVIGKIGSAYVNQTINGTEEKRKMCLAVGIAFDFKISETFALRTSYDNVSSLMLGITYHL